MSDNNTPSDRGVLILTSLAGGDKHGYALMQDIEAFAGVKLGPGTLYGALAKLEDDGLIAPLASDDRRRPYKITASGTQALTDKLSESARIARLGLRRLASASK
jgi:DNA-binding PadR family transcriptional regulator